jgi:Uma2 family endonuclease
VATLLPVDVEKPRPLVLTPPLTDRELEALAMASEWFSLERNREGEILMHPPTGGFTNDGNSEVTAQLRSWWKTHRRGRVLDSHGTFFLPDGSMFIPDSCYVLPNKLSGLTKDDLTGFLHLCPDFVIELLSKSDSVLKAKEKMERWIENGAALGWLVDLYKRKVYVYESGVEPVVVSGNAVHGKGPVEGFVLDLDELWNCYEL